MDDRQHQLKRKILALRIVAFIIVMPLGVIFGLYKTVYPHNHYQGLIGVVLVALALGAALRISRRISRLKAELGSQG